MITTELYQDPEYIAATIAILKDQIEDLEKISVYNDDKYSMQLETIKAGVEALH